MAVSLFWGSRTNVRRVALGIHVEMWDMCTGVGRHAASFDVWMLWRSSPSGGEGTSGAEGHLLGRGRRGHG